VEEEGENRLTFASPAQGWRVKQKEEKKKKPRRPSSIERKGKKGIDRGRTSFRGSRGEKGGGKGKKKRRGGLLHLVCKERARERGGESVETAPGGTTGEEKKRGGAPCLIPRKREGTRLK